MNNMSFNDVCSDNRTNSADTMKRSYVEKIWDFHYLIYDFTWAVFQKSTYQALWCETKRWNQLKVLEIGCGKAEYIKSYNKNNSYFLIDASPKMIAAAQKNVEKYQMDHVKSLTCQSIYNTSFQNDYFDVIICSHVLTVVDDFPKALDEIKRILKPSGMLLTANHIPKNSITRHHLAEKVTRLLGWFGSRDTTAMILQKGFSKNKVVSQNFSEVIIFSKD